MVRISAHVDGGVAVRFFSGFNLSSRKICKPTNGWSVCEDIPEEIAKELERLNARYCVLSETLSGETPIKQSQTKIVNACGLIRGGIINSRLTHPAWTQVPTLFGWEYHAYTHTRMDHQYTPICRTRSLCLRPSLSLSPLSPSPPSPSYLSLTSLFRTCQQGAGPLRRAAPPWPPATPRPRPLRRAGPGGS